MAISLAAAALGQLWAAADELSLAPRQGVLLLNNGEVLEGTITSAGDRYDVDLKDGQIYVKRAEVARLCRDLQECYTHKRAGIEEGRAQDHLDLAEWCLRHQLLNIAEKELTDARAAEPDHPKIRLLETRLKLAKASPPGTSPNAASEKTVSPEQLDALVRNLPVGSMESFTNTVQPMLLNHCSKSGCHGPRSTNALRLERIAPNRLAGRHPTQRNLQAALALVDRDKPEESKLLQSPIRPHGTLKAPVFTDREHSQYRQLVTWVYLVAGARESTARPSLEERGAPLLQTIPRQGSPQEIEPAESRPAGTTGVAETTASDNTDSFPDQAGPHGERPSTGLPLRIAQMHGQSALRAPQKQEEGSKQFVPKDPFDPEIFNRRFFGPQ
jgi:hypothetical protein